MQSYGAPGLMRLPGRLHITWQDDQTLKVDMDYGTQTRLLRFPAASGCVGACGWPRTWQGNSAPQWESAAAAPVAAAGRGGHSPGRFGSLTVTTTNLRPDTCGRTACRTRGRDPQMLGSPHCPKR